MLSGRGSSPIFNVAHFRRAKARRFHPGAKARRRPETDHLACIFHLTDVLYFHNNRNIEGGGMARSYEPEQIGRYADMFSAMGTEPRLRIMRLLLSAHPDGMVVGDIRRRAGDPGLHAFAPPRQAEKRGPGQGPPRRHLPLVFGQRRTRCRSCSASSTPNAARATKSCNRERLSAVRSSQ